MWRCVYLALTDVSEECIASSSHPLMLVHRSWIFLPWSWRRYVPPKRRLTQDLHSATSQKTTIFIVTAVKASKLTNKKRSDDKQLLMRNTCILEFSTSWRLHAPVALPRRKSPRYPLDRSLGGPQNRSRRRGEEKILALTVTRTPTSRSSRQ
jgi:hypothetical protein